MPAHLLFFFPSLLSALPHLLPLLKLSAHPTLLCLFMNTSRHASQVREDPIIEGRCRGQEGRRHQQREAEGHLRHQGKWMASTVIEGNLEHLAELGHLPLRELLTVARR